MNTIKTIGTIDYIEFSYSMDDLYTLIKQDCSYFIANLFSEGKIKDVDRATLTDDEFDFFLFSGNTGVMYAFNFMAPLARPLEGILKTSEFNEVERTIVLRVVKKSTINISTLDSWDDAIKNLVIQFVLRDWYQQLGFDNDNFQAWNDTLYSIVTQRVVSDLNWTNPTTLDQARTDLETAFNSLI